MPLHTATARHLLPLRFNRQQAAVGINHNVRHPLQPDPCGTAITTTGAGFAAQDHQPLITEFTERSRLRSSCLSVYDQVAGPFESPYQMAEWCQHWP